MQYPQPINTSEAWLSHAVCVLCVASILRTNICWHIAVSYLNLKIITQNWLIIFLHCYEFKLFSSLICPLHKCHITQTCDGACLLCFPSRLIWTTCTIAFWNTCGAIRDSSLGGMGVQTERTVVYFHLEWTDITTAQMATDRVWRRQGESRHNTEGTKERKKDR